MKKVDILRLEKKIGRRLFKERRIFNRCLRGGGKRRRLKEESRERRRSPRANAGVCKRNDPWCENRLLYKKEKAHVKVQETETMGYGLFATKDFRKDEVVIRMVEPTTASTFYKNIYALPWTKKENEKRNYIIRLVGNKVCHKKTVCKITVDGNPVDIKKGKVKGIIKINNNKRCAELEEQYEDDPLFIVVSKPSPANLKNAKKMKKALLEKTFKKVAKITKRLGKLKKARKDTQKIQKDLKETKEEFKKIKSTHFSKHAKKENFSHCIVPLPDDAAIRDGDGGKVFYDNTFIDMNHNPLWYRINHNKNPNVEVRTTGAGGQGPKFVCIKEIKKDEQIFFDYGVTSPKWNN